MIRTFRTAVVVCAAVAAGCLTAAITLTGNDGAAGQERTGAATEPGIGEPPVVLDSVGLRLPVQDYQLDDRQQAAVAEARIVLVGRCLDRFGIDVTMPTTVDTDGSYGPRTLTDRRYGITDAGLAARYGFGLGPRDPGLQPKPEQPDLGADGETALTGQGRSTIAGIRVPAGGCLAEADRELDAGMPTGTDTGLPQQLHLQSFEQSKNDSRVRAVFSRWSACMTDAGFDYTDPLASAGDPRFTDDRPGEKPSAEAVRVATTDVECKRRTNLVGIWYAVESAYQEQALARDAAEFRLVRQALDRQAANAAATLEATPRTEKSPHDDATT